MGYTHYFRFTRKPSDTEEGKKKFKQAVALFKRMSAKLPKEIEVDDSTYSNGEWIKKTRKVSLELAGGNGEGKPVLTDEMVFFNGRKPDDYETFSLHVDDIGFNFCKTAHQPYDVAVCLCILCFKKVFGEGFSFSSDGNRKEDYGWKMAYKMMG